MTQEEINRIRSCYQRDLNSLLRLAKRYCFEGPRECYDWAVWEQIAAKMAEVMKLLRDVEKLS